MENGLTIAWRRVSEKEADYAMQIIEKETYVSNTLTTIWKGIGTFFIAYIILGRFISIYQFRTTSGNVVFQMFMLIVGVGGSYLIFFKIMNLISKSQKRKRQLIADREAKAVNGVILAKKKYYRGKRDNKEYSYEIQVGVPVCDEFGRISEKEGASIACVVGRWSYNILTEGMPVCVIDLESSRIVIPRNDL